MEELHFKNLKMNSQSKVDHKIEFHNINLSQKNSKKISEMMNQCIEGKNHFRPRSEKMKFFHLASTDMRDQETIEVRILMKKQHQLMKDQEMKGDFQHTRDQIMKLVWIENMIDDLPNMKHQMIIDLTSMNHDHQLSSISR